MAGEKDKKPIQEAMDAIYNMYEGAAKKGYLGTKAKINAEEKPKQASWFTGKKR